MASLTPQTFYQNVSALKEPKTYLFSGDVFLVQDALERVCEKLFKTPRPSLSDNLNYEIFYASDRELERIFDSLTSLPFFSDQKLIVIKECDGFRDKDAEKLILALQKKDPSVFAVLTAQQWDKRTKNYKAIEKLSESVEFKTPYERDLPQWVQYLANQNKLQIGSRESQLLISLAGSDLMTLSQELKKIALGMAHRTRVEDGDILNFSSHGKMENVFELSDFLADRLPAKALIQFRKLLEQGHNVVAILALIARHFRILMTLAEGKKSKLTQSQLMEELGLPQFFFKKYWQQSQSWNETQLSQTLLRLKDTDKAIKSSPIPSPLVLEKFILETAH